MIIIVCESLQLDYGGDCGGKAQDGTSGYIGVRAVYWQVNGF